MTILFLFLFKNELGQLRMVVVLEKDRFWLDFSYNVEEFWKAPFPDICSCPTLSSTCSDVFTEARQSLQAGLRLGWSDANTFSVRKSPARNFR